jgi:glycerol transport system ATP-binding protein
MGIKVVNITKKYKNKTILDNLSLEIIKVSFTTILAPTGAGKTTLLRIMAGIEKATEGKVYYDGVDVTDLPVQKREISMVFQEFINYPSLTVYENIASPLRVLNKKYSKTEIDEKVKQIAQRLKISHLLKRLPGEISGGEQQRTAIARALVKGSKFIFLDEPLGNLDYKLREELRTDLKTIFKGCTVIYATPEPVDALSMSTHIAFLNAGKIIQYGQANDVYLKPSSIEVGYHFSDPFMNMLECNLVKNDKKCFIKVGEEEKFILNSIKFENRLKEGEYVIGIRPQDFKINEEESDGLSFKGKIDFLESTVSTVTLGLQWENKELVCINNNRDFQFNVGEEVKIFVNFENCFIFDKKTRKLVIANGEFVSPTIEN